MKQKIKVSQPKGLFENEVWTPQIHNIEPPSRRIVSILDVLLGSLDDTYVSSKLTLKTGKYKRKAIQMICDIHIFLLC